MTEREASAVPLGPAAGPPTQKRRYPSHPTRQLAALGFVFAAVPWFALFAGLFPASAFPDRASAFAALFATATTIALVLLFWLCPHPIMSRAILLIQLIPILFGIHATTHCAGSEQSLWLLFLAPACVGLVCGVVAVFHHERKPAA